MTSDDDVLKVDATGLHALFKGLIAAHLVEPMPAEYTAAAIEMVSEIVKHGVMVLAVLADRDPADLFEEFAEVCPSAEEWEDEWLPLLTHHADQDAAASKEWQLRKEDEGDDDSAVG